MLESEWIEKFNNNKEVLECLVASYHPAIVSSYSNNITAPNAEAARKEVCKDIQDLPSMYLFKQGIKEEEVDEAYGILSSTWFGVPESTDCWGIAGFNICVELLEDPPEEQL